MHINQIINQHSQEFGVYNTFMIELVITFLSGAFVGLSLGLTGGGGSNFAVPLLIYGVGMVPSHAMPVSLASIAIIAAIGASHAIRKNLITWKPTLIFAVGGMVGSPLGLKLANGLEEQLLLKGFAVLAMLVGSSMWWRAWRNPQDTNVVRASPEKGIHAAGPVCSVAQDGKLTFTPPCSVALSLAGVTTGLLAGFFGVGGGFIIVPALMLIIRMGIHSAVATSLVVIALTGFTGSVYAILNDRIDWSVMLLFAFGGVIGMLIGRHWAAKIAGPLLQKVFATAVVLTASAILLKTTFS